MVAALLWLASGWGQAAKRDAESCRILSVKGLPGSHEFGSDFIETMAGDPADPRVVWAVTADLSTRVPAADRALYLSKSMDGGRTWTAEAKIGPAYFDAYIAEGLRNGLAVSPGSRDVVLTTQEGAFQVFPRGVGDEAVIGPIIRRIQGPRVPSPAPLLSLPKQAGDPVRGNALAMTADGKRLIIGYGYFDGSPQLFSYHRGADGGWVMEGALPALPTDLDIFSMQYDNARRGRPRSLYVGTGDQAFHLNLRTRKWTWVRGVGPDSAIHSMTVTGGLHFAACWGVYEPVNAEAVSRVTHASFLLHRALDEVGPNIRAYGIEVDPARHTRQVLTAITGAYLTTDGGRSWRRMNDLPEGEYHAAHFNPDGSVIVSGMAGTFVANPFAAGCTPHLRRRPAAADAE